MIAVTPVSGQGMDDGGDEDLAFRPERRREKGLVYRGRKTKAIRSSLPWEMLGKRVLLSPRSESKISCAAEKERVFRCHAGLRGPERGKKE